VHQQLFGTVETETSHLPTTPILLRPLPTDYILPLASVPRIAHSRHRSFHHTTPNLSDPKARRAALTPRRCLLRLLLRFFAWRWLRVCHWLGLRWLRSRGVGGCGDGLGGGHGGVDRRVWDLLVVDDGW
jgi:hypothetical protein